MRYGRFKQFVSRGDVYNARHSFSSILILELWRDFSLQVDLFGTVFKYGFKRKLQAFISHNAEPILHSIIKLLIGVS